MSFEKALLFVAGLIGLSCSATWAGDPTDPWQHLPKRSPPTDHSTFFEGPFKDGPSVTRACLECHPRAASDIMQTAHWNLVGDEVQVPGHDQPIRIGKRNLINNFCIGIKSNWPGCTSCHIGFGWKDDSFDLSDESLVDCLVCHEQTGTYRKKAGDAGLPAADVDLLAAARSVGTPTRANCGTCHFMAGGGNAVKHGDLDASLLFPNPEIDVHMGRHGFHCVDCHQAEDHLPPGRLLTVSIDDENRLFCTNCHQGDAIHGDRRIDGHMDRVACQACHIPLMALKTGTKLSWDWSQAGQDLPITNSHLYLKIKGRFTWVKGAEPELAWYNGTGERYLLGDEIDPRRPTRIAAPLGDRDDPEAKLYPFKIHRGKQVYDTVHRHFIVPHTFGEKGFWTQFNWDDALRIGSEVTGLPFSGQYGFAPTQMYLPQNHMVPPKEEALQCPDCHGPAGRVHWRELGYEHDPIARPAFDHEPIPLLDDDGEMVHESGNPLSSAMTCSQCHELEDDAFLAAHAYHARVAVADLYPERRTLMRQGPQVPRDEAQEMNCFLCHLDRPNLDQWRTAQRAGMPEWAVAATLIGTRVTLKGGGIIERTGSGYRWNTDGLDADELAVIPMVQPRAEHCGNCHGLVHADTRPLFIELGSDENWVTETTGQLFSAQPIRLSALNLRDKDRLGQAWDLHAQRLVECRDCHYARTPPTQLMEDDNTALPEYSGEDLRTCDSCHSDGAGHGWLPEARKHFAAIACETCHTPRLHLPARRQIDASVVTRAGDYLIDYRGLTQGDPTDLARGYVAGYRPLLMQRQDADGVERWAPMNLVSRWFWIDGDSGDAVDQSTLRRAWLAAGGHRPEVVAVFDADGDGRVDAKELILDQAQKVHLIRALLTGEGVAEPRLKAEVRAHHVHHSVTLQQATRACASCHEAPADATFDLATWVPGGVLPDTFVDVTPSIARHWRRTPTGGLTITRPGPLSQARVDTGENR